MFRRQKKESQEDDHAPLPGNKMVIDYSAPSPKPSSPHLPPSFGIGPSGSMTVEVFPELECPGYDGGTIQITYNIPSGEQNIYHPNPGVPYEGTKRRSFIPNTPEGRTLLTRYKYAFQHGQMFLVGKSIVKRKDNQVTWSSIPNRTSLKGGEFGFPDPNFIVEANLALNELGIPSADEILSIEAKATFGMDEVVDAMSSAITPLATGATKPMKSDLPAGDLTELVVPIPPPYLIPGSPNLLIVSVPDAWKLSKSEAKRCTTITGDKGETKRLRLLQIPIMAAEHVIYINPKHVDGMLSSLTSSDLSELKVSRACRSLLLTSGSVQLKRLPFLKSNPFSTDRSNPNITFGIFEFRGLHMSGNVVIMTFQPPDQSDMQFALYQTPEPARFTAPLTAVVVAAYVDVPRWAIPITWSGKLPTLPPIKKENYKTFIGTDGGFSFSMYAAAMAYHVKHKLDIGRLKSGARKVSSLISKQQPPQAFPTKVNKFIDLKALADALKANDDMFDVLMLHGLRALSFNLVFRRLKLSSTAVAIKNASAFRDALSRLLLYNVTLRGIDFSQTNLCGSGEAIGKSLAMNAQPLISRVNFSSCHLTGRDLRGLLLGLARIWCGGTALAESIIMAKNPDIPTVTWDLFFETLVNPSILKFWPSDPPPPPNLAFLQELDLMDTRAVGPGLIQMAEKLTGLQSLKLSSDKSDGAVKVLQSLQTAGAPLETFEGKYLNDSCNQALFSFCDTLKEVTFYVFQGDAGRLLSGWPQAVPNLTVKFKDRPVYEFAARTLDGTGYAPGSLYIDNVGGFGDLALRALSRQAVELKNLVLFNMHYSQLAEAAPILAYCGLETLHVYTAPDDNTRYPHCDSVWSTMATSKTLRELKLSDQLRHSSSEIAMVGHFLKKNRSVQCISFDGSFFPLDVEDVKVLRAAFYGNKKVISMQYLSKAQKITMEDMKIKTERELREVETCKRCIKKIFKRHYSKYNPNWRDTPNRLKLPYVERIRVAKRKIGKMQRDAQKIGKLLGEIKDCVERNKAEKVNTDLVKEKIKLDRRKGQLKKLAQKKTKILTNIVAKLKKAKQRGSQKKSAKQQVPRSTYYKSRHMWPTASRRPHRRVNSRYRYYNDPFCARYHWQYGYYCHSYSTSRDHYLDDDDDDTCDETEREPTDECDPGVDREQGENACEAETNANWDCLLSDTEGLSSEPADPWTDMDTLIEGASSNCSAIVSSQYLAQIHDEATELGPDVVSDISRALDDGATVDNKLEEIASSMDVPTETLSSLVNNWVEEDFDVATLETQSFDIPDFEMDLGNVADESDFGADIADSIDLDADDAVSMYAGAGPRDLDDGGPSFGDFGNAAVAGARRCARARKYSRMMRRARKNAHHRCQAGYKRLSFCREPQLGGEYVESVWPSDLEEIWRDQVRALQVNAMAQSDLFVLPEVGEEIFIEWGQKQNDAVSSRSEIEVVLVTQCSLDRLPNLKAQLANWTGKASVAVYLKPEQSILDAEHLILSSIEDARRNAETALDENNSFDIAVTIVEGCMDDEAYPINYLRNVALLEARRQHLRFHTSFDKLAVFLADVDFRPSANLYEILHSSKAADSILKQRRAVVCPAFESYVDYNTLSLTGLREFVDNGQAEGFHLSHFPQGHSPTQFDKFWKESLKCHGSNIDEYWQRSYRIQHEKLFEPYVVMASEEVPLYDERFQGYGLNKVSHLATIAKQKGGEFYVLPGVFLVAPIHERSESWAKRYGSRSDETKFNQLLLKGLYKNFTMRLEAGKDPIVSEETRMKHWILSLEEGECKRRGKESKCTEALIPKDHLLVTTSLPMISSRS